MGSASKVTSKADSLDSSYDCSRMVLQGVIFA